VAPVSSRSAIGQPEGQPSDRLGCCAGFRLPETTRCADRLARRCRHDGGWSGEMDDTLHWRKRLKTKKQSHEMVVHIRHSDFKHRVPGGRNPHPQGGTHTGCPYDRRHREHGEVIIKEAEQVKEDIQQQVLTLSRWTPLGWNLKTIDYITQWVLQLPLRVPELMQKLLAHGRVLGAAGSLVMLTFLATVFYSLFGRNRVMRQINAAIQPVRHRIRSRSTPFLWPHCGWSRRRPSHCCCSQSIRLLTP